MTTTFLLLALICYRAWLIGTGVPGSYAAMAVLAYAILPATLLHALAIWSEGLFLLFSLLSLYCIGCYERQQRPIYLFAVAAMIAAASLTRSMGLSLVTAFILYLLMNRVRKSLLPGLIAVLPIVFQLLLSVILRAESGSGYLDAFLSHYRGRSPGDFFSFLLGQVVAIGYGWYFNFEYWLPLVIGLGSVCLWGAVARFRARKLDGYYIAIYLLIMLLWPFPAESERFVSVIIPIFIGQALCLCQDRMSGPRFEPRAKVVATLIFLSFVNAIPGLNQLAQRYLAAPPEITRFRRCISWYQPDTQVAFRDTLAMKVLVEDLREAGRLLSPETRIFSIKPSLVGYYAGKVAVSTPIAADDNELRKRVADEKIEYFHLMNATSPSIGTPFYPYDRLAGSLTLLRVTKLYEGAGAPVVSVWARLKEVKAKRANE
ncbi:MAG: hypothetical protein C4542_06135 [Dehalococcoidia bacterium]|nr:MAG: hypothetical protein C4542_06135 [Dehalococcoidia bacterium]